MAQDIKNINIGLLPNNTYPADDGRTYIYKRSNNHIYTYCNGNEIHVCHNDGLISAVPIFDKHVDNTTVHLPDNNHRFLYIFDNILFSYDNELNILEHSAGFTSWENVYIDGQPTNIIRPKFGKVISKNIIYDFPDIPVIADNRINLHNLNEESHPYILQLIGYNEATNQNNHQQLLEEINLKQNSNSNALSTISKNIEGAINEINARLTGRTEGQTYENIYDLITSLNPILEEEAINSFQKGKNLYLLQLDVPDFWVVEIDEVNVNYAYVNDELFLEDIRNNTIVQIGYIKIATLEVDKVFLNEFKNPQFTESETLENINSGEPHTNLWGKISKLIHEFLLHIGNNDLHVSNSDRTNWNNKLSTQVQSDWNQENDELPDYIKNKPSLETNDIKIETVDFDIDENLTQVLNLTHKVNIFKPVSIDTSEPANGALNPINFRNLGSLPKQYKEIYVIFPKLEGTLIKRKFIYGMPLGQKIIDGITYNEQIPTSQIDITPNSALSGNNWDIDSNFELVLHVKFVPVSENVINYYIELKTFYNTYNH